MKTLVKKDSQKSNALFIIFCILAMACFLIATGYATSMTIGTVASHVTDTLGDVAKLITAGSYVAGFGFAVGAILKFKAHKDNPTQIPVGTPIALIFIAAALIFMPTIFGVAGETLFGSTSGTGGISGVTSF